MLGTMMFFSFATRTIEGLPSEVLLRIAEERFGAEVRIEGAEPKSRDTG